MTIIEAIAENKVRLVIGNFLSKILFENKFILIDIWMFVHIIAGGLIMFTLNLFKLKAKWRYSILEILLVGFEIVEFFLYTTLTTIFIPETLGNVLLDIVVGFMAAGIVDLIFFIRSEILQK